MENKRITIVFDYDFYEKIKEHSKKDKKTVGGFIKNILFEELKKRGAINE